MPRVTKPATRSCRECQKRKTRCSGTAPCSYCSRTKKTCLFEAPPSRTSLTRQNLDETERRCEALESLLRSLHPDLDIQAALQQQTRSNEQQPSTTDSISGTVREPSPSLNRFEWREYPPPSKPGISGETVEPGDGMASLPVVAGNTGYLGSSSGSTLLETVFTLLPASAAGTASPSTPGSNNVLKSPRKSPRGVKHDQLPPAELEVSKKLNTTAVTAGLIDAYFSLYNTSYPVLHENNFRREFQDLTRVRPTSSGRLTYYMVLAIGHWLLSEGNGDDNSPYYHAARSSMSVRILESGSIDTVQALLLLGNYLQKRDRPNTGYNYIGLAMRIALGLGLHRELQSPDESTDVLLRERRREVWWILYSMESGFSITTGRPLTLNDATINIHMPCNCEDISLSRGNVWPQPVSHPTNNSAIIAQAALAVVANRIYSSVLSINTKNQEIDFQEVLALATQLSTWKSNLPPYFFSIDVPSWFLAPRAMIMWKEQNIRIMLWQGGERSQFLGADKSLAAARFHEAAAESIYSISTFCEERADLLHQGISWYATYFLFQAALALDIFHLRHRSLQNPIESEISWNTSMTRAKKCLRQLGRTNPAAQRCLSVLDRIHDHLADVPSDTATGTGVQDVSTSIGPLDHTLSSFDNDWISSADPSLFMFLDDISMPTLLDGVAGFPGTQEPSNFDYTFGNLYDNKDATQTWYNNPF